MNALTLLRLEFIHPPLTRLIHPLLVAAALPALVDAGSPSAHLVVSIA